MQVSHSITAAAFALVLGGCSVTVTGPNRSGDISASEAVRTLTSTAAECSVRSGGKKGDPCIVYVFHKSPNRDTCKVTMFPETLLIHRDKGQDRPGSPDRVVIQFILDANSKFEFSKQDPVVFLDANNRPDQDAKDVFTKVDRTSPRLLTVTTRNRGRKNIDTDNQFNYVMNLERPGVKCQTEDPRVVTATD